MLTPREARIVSALAETMFPTEGTTMPTVEEARVVDYFDDLLAHLPLKEKLLIRCLTALLEVQMLAFNGLRPSLFSRAKPEDRTRNLAGWETSSLFQRRLVFMAIRTLLLWAYVDSQEVERSMGLTSGTEATRRRNEERLAEARKAIFTAQGHEEAQGRKDTQGHEEAPRSLAPPELRFGSDAYEQGSI